MRTEHVFISLLGLCLSFLMIFCGLFLFLSSYVPSVKQAIRTISLHHLEGVSYCGLIACFFGVVVISFLLWLNRRRYLLIKMSRVSVEDRLIAGLAQEGLQALFPGQLVECDVVVKRKNKIEILANLPFVEEQIQQKTLRDIEAVLVAILQKQCQYEKDFILNVSFASE